MPVKINHAIVLRAPEQLFGVFLAGALHQDALARVDHGLADGSRLLVDLRLQGGEPLFLDLKWRVVGKAGRRRTRSGAVDETETVVEAHVPDQFHGLRNRVQFPPESPR